MQVVLTDWYSIVLKNYVQFLLFIHPIGSSRVDQTWPQGLKWDLPTSNPNIPRQASIESSEEELEWSDLSFYDLPVTLKVSMLNINFVQCIPLTY